MRTLLVVTKDGIEMDEYEIGLGFFIDSPTPVMLKLVDHIFSTPVTCLKMEKTGVN
jgi:hypothetical protein